jgi:hypothetical protein
MSQLDPLMDYTKMRLGHRVDRETDNILTGEDLFTVTGGRVLVTQIIGEVTTIIESKTVNFKLASDPTVGTTNDMCANLDLTGAEVGTFNYQTPGTSFTFKAANGDVTDVGLAYQNDKCGKFPMTQELDQDTPGKENYTANLIGLQVNNKLYRLAKPKKIVCDGMYGGGADDPSLGGVNYLGDHFVVNLPDGSVATISLDKKHEVKFSNP